MNGIVFAKKFLVIFFIVAIIICLVFIFSACEEDDAQEPESISIAPPDSEIGLELEVIPVHISLFDDDVLVAEYHGIEELQNKLPTIDKKIGYHFMCWQDAMGTQVSTFENFVEYAKGKNEIKLYPLWEKDSFNIAIQGKSDCILLYEEVVSKEYLQEYTFAPKERVGYVIKSLLINGEPFNEGDAISIDKDITIVVNYEIEKLDTPIIIINTFNNTPIVDKTNYIDAKVSIINTNEELQIDEADAGVRGRGNYTWTLDKKGYRIKFSSKTSIFGTVYKQKSWTLIPNYTDKSLSRNYIAHEMAAQFDNINFASIHEFVELYLNGEYLGVYLLCDQIQTGEGRLAIDESYINEIDPGNIGYFLEMDSYAPEEGEEDVDYVVVDGMPYAIKTPDTDSNKYDAGTCATYIKTYLSNCLDALDSSDWDSVFALIDVNSFADTYIIHEVVANTDIDWSSFYLYKDKDGKLYSGPVWDFDLAAGDNKLENDDLDYYYSPTKELVAGEINCWYKKLLTYSQFRAIVLDKLEAYETTILGVINELDEQNNTGLYATYGEALERNFIRWDIFDITIYPNPLGLQDLKSVRAHMDYLRNWLLLRYYWVRACYEAA